MRLNLRKLKEMNSITFDIDSRLLTPFSLPLRIRAVEKIRLLFALISGKGEELKIREERFASILQEYGSVISGICFSYSTNADDLKDLRQDILINIWKGLGSFRGESSLSTWVYRVALNTCVSTVRKRTKHPSTISLDLICEPNDETDHESRERIESLHRIIATLSPLDKAVITMWLDERKYEEIAEVTGLSRNNVAVRINRIKQKLAEKFEK